MKQNRMSEGVAELEHAVQLSPDTVQWIAQLGQAHAMTGNVDAAHTILAQLEQPV
jgi:cytochrome c-type biogenesis protein CcmH/NrfG